MESQSLSRADPSSLASGASDPRKRPAVFVGFAMATGAGHPENIIEVFFSAADLTSTPLSGANIA
jgi:hypothetical protein